VPVSQVIGNVNVVQPGPQGIPAAPYGTTSPYGASPGPYGSQGAAGGFGASPYGSAPAGAYGAPATPYSAPGMQQNLPVGTINPPPSLHWGLVLLFSIFSCLIFAWVWCMIQAVWVRKIRPGNNGLYHYIASCALNYVGSFALSFIILANAEFR